MLVAVLVKAIQPKRIANAPVKEVKITGKKVNLFDLPVPVFSVMDGGPMITAGVVIADDDEFGINAGIYRLMLKERNITGIDIVTPNNMRLFTATMEQMQQNIGKAMEQTQQSADRADEAAK